jgi:hypothetical protein
VPGLNRLDPVSDYWRFTEDGLIALLAEFFADYEDAGHGNNFVTAAFLTGLASEELPRAQLDAPDRRFPLVLTARAVRS